MEIGTLLLDLALLGVVAYIILRPMLGRAPSDKFETDPNADLLAERERLLAALRELEMDQATGKVEAEEGARLRAQLVAEGAAILRQLDQANARPAARRKAKPERTTDDDIEAAISLVRRSRGRQVVGAAAPTAVHSNACPACGAAAQGGDRFCAACGAELRAACRQCGSALAEHDRFCAICGAAVAQAGATPMAREAQP